MTGTGTSGDGPGPTRGAGGPAGPTAFDLTSRTALVTGAGTGLGARAAVALAGAGAHVVVVGRRPGPLDDTVGEIRERGGTAEACSVDVTDETAVRDLFRQVGEHHGGVDVLVNNAAVEHEAYAVDLAPDQWRLVLEINLTGTFLCAQAMARQEVDRARSIVNISSLASAAGVPGQAAYAASKGGVESLTRTLAVELARRRIRVNALAPGYFRTEMPALVFADPAMEERLVRKIPLGRIADPSEIGPPIVFLASAASSYMTGAVLRFDGGFTAR